MFAKTFARPYCQQRWVLWVNVVNCNKMCHLVYLRASVCEVTLFGASSRVTTIYYNPMEEVQWLCLTEAENTRPCLSGRR